MTIVLCGTCDQQIVDNLTDSIACDACQKWVHAKKECSNTKKSLFNILSKNDTWLCPGCIQLCKSNLSHIEALKKELINHSKLAQNLLDENKNLKQQLNEKEIKIIELKTQIELHSPLSRQDKREGDWEKVGGRSGRGWESLRNETLETSNRFEPLTVSELDESGGSDLEIVEIVGGGGKSKKSANKAKMGTRSKILVVGDSHVRGCKLGLSKILGENWDVRAHFSPGAPMGTAIMNADQKLRETGDNGAIIMVGGVNDVSDKGIQNTLEKSSQLGRVKGRKIVWVEAPHRFDVTDQNGKIEKQSN